MPSPDVGHPVGSAPLRRPALDAFRVRDEAVRAVAYRQFLCETQDVMVSSIAYPGGISALIRDRESITLRLVRLLRDA